MFVVLSAEDGAGDIRLRVRRGEYGPRRYVQQPRSWSFSLPGWWKPQAVSQQLGPVCSGTAADPSESDWQAVQDPRRLGQKEAQVPKVCSLFSSQTVQTRFFQVTLKLTNQCMWHWYCLTRGEKNASCFGPGVRCLSGNVSMAKIMWKRTPGITSHHIKVVSIFKPSECERWLSAAFASLYGAADTCHLSVYSYTHALSLKLRELRWSIAHRASSVYRRFPFTAEGLLRGWAACRADRGQPSASGGTSLCPTPRQQQVTHTDPRTLPFNRESEALTCNKRLGFFVFGGEVFRKWSAGCALITDSELWA